MVFRVLYAAFVASLIVFYSSPAIAANVKPAEFSATVIMTNDGNTSDAKLYFTPKKQRMEVKDQGSDSKSVIITRADKEVVWMLMTSEEMYMEMPIENEKKNPVFNEPDNVIKRERVGKDTVDGHPAIKEKITFRKDDGKKESMYSWTATDLGWPVKGEALDGSWSYTYKDIKTGKQDPELFEVPKGYKRVSGLQPPAETYSEPEPQQPDYPSMPEPYIPDIPAPPVPW